MAKRITKIVLTGGPAAGKTTLVSRVLMSAFTATSGRFVV